MLAPIVDGSQQQEELMVEGGTINYLKLLNSLTEALQNSGVDLTQASISVQVDIGKRANRGLTSTSKTNNTTVFQEFSNGENSDQSEAQKRLNMCLLKGMGMVSPIHMGLRFPCQVNKY
ncbi:hypothetical protein LXL04_016059 [Taraxacum kok-saghyz]